MIKSCFQPNLGSPTLTRQIDITDVACRITSLTSRS